MEQAFSGDKVKTSHLIATSVGWNIGNLIMGHRTMVEDNVVFVAIAIFASWLHNKFIGD